MPARQPSARRAPRSMSASAAGHASRNRSKTASLFSCPRFALQSRRNAFHVQPDLVDAGARRNVERLVFAVAELVIGRELRFLDSADMLSIRQYNVHAVQTGIPLFALDVDPQPVGDAARR